MADRYQFVRKVAQGGFGEVYTAFDRTLKREVAIKRLLNKNDGVEEAAAEEAFQREALVLAAMQHPNIVNIFDFDRDEEGTFVVMEMLEGKTLKEALDRGALTWEDFHRLVRQTLDAIVAAHKADILHRDLKPENIFLKRTVTGSWTVKVLDFGLAKLSQTPSRQTMDGKGNVFGSIYYMAPEQFKREALDARTDIYALGCLFYQALTQRFPFEGENMAGTMDAHLNHLVKSVELRRKDTPPAVAAWLMKMISADRKERPATALAARKEFEDALDGKMPVPAGMVALPPTVTSSSRTTTTAGPPPAPVARPPMTAAPARSNGNGSSGGIAVATAPPTQRSAPVQRGAPTASPARATSGVVTVNPRPVMSTSTVTRTGEEGGWAKYKNYVLAGVPVLLAVGFFAFIMGRGEESKAAGTTNTSTTPKPAAPAASTTPSSSSPSSNSQSGWPSSLPKAVALTLPLEDQLVWRCRADTEIWHKGLSGNEDRRTPTGQGARIHVWKSVAPVLKEVWMRGYSNTPETLPAVTVGDCNGPGTARTRLSFANEAGLRNILDSSAALKVPGNGVAGSTGVTVAAVFRANASKKDKSIRPVLLSSSWSKDTLSIHHSHIAGQYWARVQHGETLVLPLVRPAAFEKKGSPWLWSVVVAVWDAKAGKVRVAVRSPDGKITHSDEASLPPGMPMMDQLTFGYYPLPSDTKLEKEEKFDGDMTEVAVYQHALDRSNQEKVLNGLWDCYFLQR